MIEGRLDELGWHQFEDFVQTLLKAALGTGVEAWGGRGDYGRDCYCPSPLRFPNQELNPGPFLFQAKFVSGANATGANYIRAIAAAVTAEVERIRARIEADAWETPADYVLVTNCPLQPLQREKLAELLLQVISESKIHFLTSKDLSGLSADHPNVRRFFPQLLGLGDLEELIVGATNKDLLERSKIALESAALLAPVFVPTRAYDRAWQILGQHSFAVLEGPPEMGKTAIAITIGAVKHFDGWEIYECRTPDDFFRAFSEERQQFFIADDAFGRTEYDPSLGKQWERELDKLLRRVDKRHWLVWTSRKHILERALHSLDLQGAARAFPNPSAVLVDATDLTVSEKTLILFRHARHARLEEALKEIVKTNGRRIVRHEHFTPERIRRFVTQALPRIVAEHSGNAPAATSLSLAVIHEISNPTDSMRKSFAALSASHKAFLYALIETSGEHDAVMTSYARLVADESFEKGVRDIVDELSHSFIRVFTFPNGEKTLYQWMHPSIRDLVIDELATAPEFRRMFLRVGSIGVIKLALSEEGGDVGSRLRPLLQSKEDWEELTKTCERLIENGIGRDIRQVIYTLDSVDRNSLGQESLLYDEVVVRVCNSIRQRWDKLPSIASTELFESVGKLTERVSPLPSLPNPQSLWDEVVTEARDAASYYFDIEPIESLSSFLRLVRVLVDLEPRFLAHVGFPEQFEELIEEIEDKMARNIPSKENDLDVAADIASGALDALDMARTVPALSGLADKLHDKYTAAVETIAEAKAREEPDEEYDANREPTDHFSDSMIDSVLSDI